MKTYQTTKARVSSIASLIIRRSSTPRRAREGALEAGPPFARAMARPLPSSVRAAGRPVGLMRDESRPLARTCCADSFAGCGSAFEPSGPKWPTRCEGSRRCRWPLRRRSRSPRTDPTSRRQTELASAKSSPSPFVLPRTHDASISTPRSLPSCPLSALAVVGSPPAGLVRLSTGLHSRDLAHRDARDVRHSSSPDPLLLDPTPATGVSVHI